MPSECFNIVSITMIAVAAGEHIVAGTTSIAYQTRATTQTLTRLADPNRLPRTELPDIYYIILDRYANDEVLRKYLHHDNDVFMRFLASNGFYVAGNSVANYPGTLRSIGSSLSMDYLEKYRPSSASSAAAEAVWATIYQDNAVVEIVKSQGYRYIHSGTAWILRLRTGMRMFG